MSDESTPADEPEPTQPDGPTQPDEPYEPTVMRWRGALPGWIKRRLAPTGSRRRAWWWERLFVPVPTSDDYKKKDEVLNALRQTQGDRSAAVLGEAREIFERPFQTTAGVERRASTLQGAIAIAATFVVAGGGLLLNASEIQTDGWRIAFAVVFVLVIMCLVFSALRALRATSRVLIWHYPDEEDLLLRRTSEYASDHELAVAAELLQAGARNANNARYKVAQMRAAGHWLALALVGLLITAVVFLAYVVAGPAQSASQNATSNRTSANIKIAVEIAASVSARERQELERLAKRLNQKGDPHDRRGAELITGLLAGLPGDAALFAVWAEQSTDVARELLAELLGTIVKAGINTNINSNNVTVGGSTINEGGIYFSFESSSENQPPQSPNKPPAHKHHCRHSKRHKPLNGSF
ncbi:MAG: hypothetical protein ABSG93_07620 [Solirubrobacteraceae bacterium]|jgi:hypothetical protein